MQLLLHGFVPTEVCNTTVGSCGFGGQCKQADECVSSKTLRHVIVEESVSLMCGPGLCLRRPSVLRRMFPNDADPSEVKVVMCGNFLSFDVPFRHHTGRRVLCIKS